MRDFKWKEAKQETGTDFSLDEKPKIDWVCNVYALRAHSVVCIQFQSILCFSWSYSYPYVHIYIYGGAELFINVIEGNTNQLWHCCTVWILEHRERMRLKWNDFFYVLCLKLITLIGYCCCCFSIQSQRTQRHRFDRFITENRAKLNGEALNWLFVCLNILWSHSNTILNWILTFVWFWIEKKPVGSRFYYLSVWTGRVYVCFVCTLMRDMEHWIDSVYKMSDNKSNRKFGVIGVLFLWAFEVCSIWFLFRSLFVCSFCLWRWYACDLRIKCINGPKI